MRLESCTCQMVRSVPKSTRTCTCTCDIYELEYRLSTLWDIVYSECILKLIKHEAKPSALLGLETHSKYTISHKVRGNG